MIRFLLFFTAGLAAASPSPLPDRLQETVDEALIALDQEGSWPVPSWLKLQVPGEDEKPAFGQRYAAKIDLDSLAECSRYWPFVLTGEADQLRAHRDGRLCSKSAFFDGSRWQALEPPADLSQFRWLPDGIMYRGADQVHVFPPEAGHPDDTLGDTTPSAETISLTRLGFQASTACKLYVNRELQVYDALGTLWLRRVANSATAPELGLILDGDLKVLTVIPGSPAAEANLQAEDVLLAMDDHPLLLPADLWRRLGKREPGSLIRLQIDGVAPRNVDLVLGPLRPLFPPPSPGHELGELLLDNKPLTTDISWIATEATLHGVAHLLEAMSSTQTLPPFALALVDRLRAHGYQAWAASSMALGLHAMGEFDAAEDAHEHGLGLPNYGSRLLSERFAFPGARHPWQQLRDELELPATRADLDANGLAETLPPLVLNTLLLKMLQVKHFPPGSSAIIARLRELAHKQPWYLDTVAWALATNGQRNAGRAIFADEILPRLEETRIDAALRESYQRFCTQFGD